MASLATGPTAMEELQIALAMPEPSLTRAGNNRDSKTARKTRDEKFTAIVEALRQMKTTGQLPPNILDGDGDLEFDPNSLEDQTWDGALASYNQLSANDQALMLNNAIAQANFVIGRGGDDDHVPTPFGRDDDMGGSNEGSSAFRPVSPGYPFSPPPQSPFAFASAPPMGTNVEAKEDGGGGGGIAAAVASETTDLAQQRATTFDAYQDHITALVQRIDAMQVQTQTEQQRRVLIQEITNNMYGIFFGHLPDGTPTQFYRDNGAAPICGMNAQQLVAVATRARTIDRAIDRFSEQTLGFLRYMFETVRQTNMGAPFSYISDLMEAVRRVHMSAYALIQADPLFVEHRSRVAAEGGYAVRSFVAQATASMLSGGTTAVREVLRTLNPKLASDFNNWVRAENRDGPMAIEAFERALMEYDRVYQSLPLEFRNCWVLPYPRRSREGIQGERQGLSRTQNKPGAAEVTLSMDYMNAATQLQEQINMAEGQHFNPSENLVPFIAAARESLAQRGEARAVQNPEEESIYRHITGPQIVQELRMMAQQQMSIARGFVLENPIPCYPRFLTMNEGLNDAGPLLAYYYALHGGQQQFLAQGRDYLNKLFAENPQRFMKEMQPLLDTLDNVRDRSAASRRAGDGVFPENTLAAAKAGDTGPMQERMDELSGTTHGERARARYGTVYGPRGEVPLRRATDILEASAGTNVPEFQEQQRAAREEEVRRKRQREIAVRSLQMLKQNRADEWIKGLRSNLLQATRDLFNGKQNERGAELWAALRELLNTKLQLKNGKQITVFQLILRLNTYNIHMELLQKFIEPNPNLTADQIMGVQSNLPLLNLLSRRMNPGDASNDWDGVTLMLGSIGAQLLTMANAARAGQEVTLPFAGAPQLADGEWDRLASEINNNALLRGLMTDASRTRGSYRGAETTRRKKQGGKRTRRRKMKRKRTRRHKMKRKRTRHHRKRKKHTRKH